jgi:Type II CAAX prenyl endopeptidase Rce1-like
MNPMKLRLILSLALPTLLVVVGINLLHNAVLAFLLYAVGGCLIGPWLLVGARPLRSAHGWTFVGRGGDRMWMHGVAWLITGAGLFGLYFLLKPWLLDSVEVASRLRSLAMPERGLAVFLFGFVCTVPVAEEWWWRGQTLPRCREAFGPRLGLVLSVLGFSGYHAVVLSALYDPLSVAIRMVAIIAGGFLFAAMALRTRGWRWAWSAHFAADLAIVLAFLFLVAPDM